MALSSALADAIKSALTAPPADSDEACEGVADAINAYAVGAVPIGGIIPANLSAGDISTYFTGGLGNSGQRWEGWAICNGSNGTPNLSGKFPKATTGASGTTGGSDTIADHDHLIPWGFDSTNEYWYTNGSSQPAYQSAVLSGVSRFSIVHGASQSTGSVRIAATEDDGGHDNRPAFYELTFLMRVS